MGIGSKGRGALSVNQENEMTNETSSGAVAPINEHDLDAVAGGLSGGGSAVVVQDLKGDPSQWGAQVYKKGSFDITE